jgi:hypothetical protein
MVSGHFPTVFQTFSHNFPNKFRPFSDQDMINFRPLSDRFKHFPMIFRPNSHHFPTKFQSSAPEKAVVWHSSGPWKLSVRPRFLCPLSFASDKRHGDAEKSRTGRQEGRTTRSRKREDRAKSGFKGRVQRGRVPTQV